VFNELTGLPPYLGMLGGLGALWLLTDIIHAGEERASLKVRSAQSQRFTGRGPCFRPALTIDYCIIPSCV
jgi:hypothetical protein